MIVQDVRKLEEKSIFIIREAKEKFKNMAALWSMGKDSTAMLAVARKAFMGKVPFPVIHIDNGIDFPETYEFRKKLADKWGLDLIVGKTKIKHVSWGLACCGETKTIALKEVMKEYGFDALMMAHKERRALDTSEGEVLLAQEQELQVGLQEPACRAVGRLFVQAGRERAT